MCHLCNERTKPTPFQTALIHLGAKYAPCMRWDEALDRGIREERLKERDTACCIRKDRAGCVQSPKTECSKVGDGDGSGGGGAGPPRSNWVRPALSSHMGVWIETTLRGWVGGMGSRVDLLRRFFPEKNPLQ